MNIRRTILSVLTLLSVTLCLGGEGRTVVIRTAETPKCCECDCEYNPMEDAKWYDEPLTYRYRFFGGVPHICLGNHPRDEKGIDLSEKHHPHVCRGEWCDKRCCISLEDFAYLQEEYDRHIRGNIIRYPVIPGPGPVTRDN